MPKYKDLDTTFDGKCTISIMGKPFTIRILGQKFDIGRNVNGIAWEALNADGKKDKSLQYILMEDYRDEVEEQLQAHIDKRESYLD